MKKYILLILSLLTIFVLYKQVSAEESIIPDEAIRFRVIANSNSVYDQNVKIQVRNMVQNKLLELTGKSTDIEETRRVIKSNIDVIDNMVGQKLKEINYDSKYKIKYGYNYFPKKKYKGITYKEGNYESLVIELGDAKGNNWWCVLFPPLCLLESEENQESSDTEYTFFVKELVDKYFK